MYNDDFWKMCNARYEKVNGLSVKDMYQRLVTADNLKRRIEQEKTTVRRLDRSDITIEIYELTK